MFRRRSARRSVGVSETDARGPAGEQNATAEAASAPFVAVEMGGSSLHLDLCDGAATVLERLRGVNPGAILKVTLEVNLMSELIFDQQWMEIFECIGSLPFIHTVSLGFRVPTPIPMQAFTKLIELAVPLENLSLVGLQLSATKMATRRSKRSIHQNNNNNDPEVSPVEEMIRAFQEAQSLKHVQLVRYRPMRSFRPLGASPSGSGQEVDPLLRALSNLPCCKVFHFERTDIFSQPVLLDLICRAHFPTLRIGPQDRALTLEHHLPRMAHSLNDNAKLTELIVQHNIDDGSLEAMAHLLQNNHSLEKVSLLRLQSTNFGAGLAAALESNTTLQSLELNVLSRDRTVLRQNFVALATSLSHGNPHSALVTLKIDVPGVRNSSSLATEPFLKMLRNDNFVLQTVVINRNTVPLHKDILFFLKLNRLGRNRLLRREREGDNYNYDITNGTGLVGREVGAANDNDGKQTVHRTLREAWVDTLIENKDDIRLLHYFICHDPAILPCL